MSPQTNDPFLIHVSHRDIDDGKKTPITRYDVLFLFRSNTNTRATSPRHAFIDDTNATNDDDDNDDDDDAFDDDDRS